jgi:inner membrane protease subunit 1
MASFLRIGHPFRALVTAGKIVATFHVFSEYGYTFAPAGGPSMLPTFERDGEWLLTSKRHRHARRVAVGDLVVYKIPYSPDTEGIKRVLGLPGDYVLLNSPKSGSDTMIQVRFYCPVTLHGA